MLVTNWLSGLWGRIHPTARPPRPRRRSGWTGAVAAEVQVLEARALLSAAGTDIVGVAHTTSNILDPIASSPPTTIAAPIEAPPSAPVTTGAGMSAGNDLSGATPVKTLNATAGNNTGNVVLATFTDANPPGRLLTIHVPGSISTTVTGISGNDIFGGFRDASGHGHYFVFDGSTYTAFDAPQGMPYMDLRAASGNTVVGNYLASDVYTGAQFHGFVFNGSTVSSFDVPGAVETFISGVSGNSMIGWYRTSENSTHDFLYDGSKFITIDAGSTFRYADPVSGRTVTGLYNDSDGPGVHAEFLYDGATVPPTNPPGSIFATHIMTPDGTYVGTYYDASYRSHGFVNDGVNITTLDVPGAALTRISGVSGKYIVGTYQTAETPDGGGTTGVFLYDGSTFTTLDVTGNDASVISLTITSVSGNLILGQYVIPGIGPTGDYSTQMHSFLYQIGTTGTGEQPGADPPASNGLSPPPIATPTPIAAPTPVDSSAPIAITTPIATPIAISNPITISIERIESVRQPPATGVSGQSANPPSGPEPTSPPVVQSNSPPMASDAIGSGAQDSNTTIAVAAAPGASAVTPPAPALMANSDQLAALNSQGETSNNSPAPVKAIAPVVFLGLDAAPADASATWQADKTYWSSLDQAALMFSDIP